MEIVSFRFVEFLQGVMVCGKTMPGDGCTLGGNSAQNGSFRICNPEMLLGFYPPNQQLALSRVGILFF